MIYRLEIGVDLHPQNKRQYLYPGAIEGAGGAGTVVHVNCNSCESWWGIFGEGFDGVTALYDWPAARRFCILCNGAGYIISVDNPKDWFEIGLFPIRYAIPVSEKDSLIVADWTRVAMYRPAGMVWTTPRLGPDSLIIDEVSETEVRGSVWDGHPGEEDFRVTFCIDVTTGKHEGGAI